MVKPKISIIVPVYNAEKYLRRCIDSILAQTFTDFELLLIDDGSKDESRNICDDYASMDIRVRVIHKENGGVSSARNCGIDEANGVWVTFIDADDLIKIEFLQSLISKAEANDEMIVGGNTYFGEKVGETVPPENKIVHREHFKDYIFTDTEWTWQRIFYVVWGKLFRLSIIKENGLRFNTNMVMSEDTVFVLEFMSTINTVRLLKVNNYSYFFECSQKTYYEFSLNKLKAQQNAFMSAMNRITNSGIGHFNNVIALSKGICFYKYLLSLTSRERFIEGLKSYKKYDNNFLNIFTDKKHKLYFGMLFTFPCLGYYIHKVLKK